MKTPLDKALINLENQGLIDIWLDDGGIVGASIK